MIRNSVKLLKQCENYIFKRAHHKNLAMIKSACQKQDKLGYPKRRVIAIKSSVTLIKTSVRMVKAA